MSGSPGNPITVVGGPGGITANAAAILELGARYGAAADDCRRRGRDLDSLLDPTFGLLVIALAGSTRVDPALLTARGALGSAAFEVCVLAAALDDLGRKLVATALRYGDLDQHMFGNLLGGLAGLVHTLVGDGAAFWTTLLGTRNFPRSVQAAFTAHPGQLDPVVRKLTPVVSAFDALAVDGRGVVRNPGTDTFGTAAVPPRSLTDVLDDLAQRDADGRSGEIDVRILSTPGGGRKVIVDVTGTKSWDPFPTRDVTSLPTNARAVMGLPTAYEQGVLAAMRRAGVRRDDDVLMVGHSEGGMVAADAARDAVRTGQFRVTHVVTVGSPIGRSVGAMPGRTAVLALENRSDVIPHLDGRANPDRRNVTTVTGRAGDGTISGDHDIVDSYEPIARDVERNRSRSVRDFLDGIDGYFRADSVVTHTYQIERI